MKATRNTKQKTALRNAFLSEDRPLSPEEALEIASESVEGLGLATVYRNIKSLLNDGFLTTVELVNEPPRYEVAGKAHHHHFRCNDCNRVLELHGCFHQVNKMVPRGFEVDEHHILFYGRCKDCTRIENK